MYSWGWAKFGQCGHGSKMHGVPRRIDHPDARNIVKVACGNRHTVATNRDGVCISFGCGKHYQTGHGIDEDKVKPERIAALADERIVEVACGAIHSCMINDEGDLFLCGFGEYFHPNESQHFFHTPTKINMPEPVKMVACGQSHNIALSVSGNVYGWGSGEYGQIGYGMEGNLSTPRLVLDGKSVASVAAGRYHSFALTNSGIMYSWGCGENGQLGQNNDKSIALPTIVTTILGTVVGQVSCGEHHTAVLTSAPWSKLSQDTARWQFAANVEHELKKTYLKKTHRGLTRKDLSRLREDMKKWSMLHEEETQKITEDDKESRMKDILSIQTRDTLQDSIMESLKDGGVDKGVTVPAAQDGRAASAVTLPSVQGSSSVDEDAVVTRELAEEKTMVKLPRVKGSTGPTGLSKTQSVRALAGPAASGVGMHSKTMQLSEYNPDDTMLRGDSMSDVTATDPHLFHMAMGFNRGNAQVPLARTGFLKDTAAMVKRMTAVVQDKGEVQNTKQLQKMLRLVFGFRKDYDSLRHKARNKSKKLADIKKEIKLLEKSQKLSRTTQDDNEARLEALKMQLNTVTIKIAETGENRKNYELNIAHLKEEDFEHFDKLKNLRKKNNDTNSFFKKMNDLRTQAMEEREKADNELMEFRHEIDSYQYFVKQQLQQFESILEIVRVQNEKREKAKFLRTEKQRQKVSARIHQLNAEVEAADKEASGLTARLTSLDLKLRHFEDSFQKITAATGLTNPDAIVNKYFFKGEIKDQLQTEIDDKQNMIEELKKTQGEYKHQLSLAKESFKEQTWRDVELLTENLREVEFRRKKAKNEDDRMTQKVAFVQEGLVNLLRTCESALSTMQDLEMPEESGSVWEPEEADVVLTRMMASVEKLQEASDNYHRVKEEERREMEKEMEQNAANEAKAMLFGVNMRKLKSVNNNSNSNKTSTAIKAGAEADPGDAVAGDGDNKRTHNIGSNRPHGDSAAAAAASTDHGKGDAIDANAGGSGENKDGYNFDDDM